MASFERTLVRLAVDLEAMALQWAIVGGLAVSARSEPRTTRDIDVVVVVSEDLEAEQAILALREKGYRDAGEIIEQDVTGRLATMRMISPGDDDAVVIDLIFASTGIEQEVVAASPSCDEGAGWTGTGRGGLHEPPQPCVRSRSGSGTTCTEAHH